MEIQCTKQYHDIEMLLMFGNEYNDNDNDNDNIENINGGIRNTGQIFITKYEGSGLCSNQNIVYFDLGILFACALDLTVNVASMFGLIIIVNPNVFSITFWFELIMVIYTISDYQANILSSTLFIVSFVIKFFVEVYFAWKTNMFANKSDWKWFLANCSFIDATTTTTHVRLKNITDIKNVNQRWQIINKIFPFWNLYSYYYVALPAILLSQLPLYDITELLNSRCSFNLINNALYVLFWCILCFTYIIQVMFVIAQNKNRLSAEIMVAIESNDFISHSTHV